ncbi:c-type cytochrome [Rhodovulum sp. DZ06]|uniref:c-type cytochrome n=1 Tax=Rhodovulum sp. DZ06 TaxID=3425126 RepID=UPI003D332829
MTTKLPRAAFAAALIALSSGIGGALAHGGASGIVLERMEAMKDVAAAMKTVGPMIQGKTAWDPEAAQAAAATIASHGGAALTRLFPEGSGGGVSEASPAIWTDRARFDALAAELKDAAEALEAASAGAEPPTAEFGRLAGTCKSCHEAYRVKK